MDNLVYNAAFHVDSGTSSTNLQSKEKFYSTEPPYKCKFCDRRFLYSSKLQIHKRIHTGERPYKCKYCGYGFLKSSNLKTHERIHIGEQTYKCKFCNLTFTQNGNLQNHENIHTGERQFQCKYCGRSFADSSIRSLHLLACSLKEQNTDDDTDLLQNSGTVNFTSNVGDQHINFDKMRYEGKNIDSQTVWYHVSQPSTCQGFESENSYYVSNDEIYKCRLCSFSFGQENELKLHYITHFDSL